jgi:sugar phosphate isomerase/epimerase
MSRAVTLFTGQWADLSLDDMAKKAASFGFDGLELACWGDHIDVDKAAKDKLYCKSRHDILVRHGLNFWAISNHLVGQAVCDPIDERHKRILPPEVWGDGEPEGVRQRAAEEMKRTAQAAANLGVNVVNGFTGSNIWSTFYFFPPTSDDDIRAGYDDFARRWGPILDAYRGVGVRFALEVHPGEIAYDIITAQRALEAVGHHKSFGFNFDPSHLVWQGVDPVRFIDRFADRIFHVHMKDAAVFFTPRGGEASILGSHLQIGDHRRAWEFRSVGRGHVNFEEIIRALNRIGYTGPLSVEWEDAAMNREHGARESLEYVRKLDFQSSSVVFDEAFRRKERH